MKKLTLFLLLFLSACNTPDPEEMTVYFSTHDDVLIEQFTIIKGDAIEMIEAPEREGYDFIEWVKYEGSTQILFKASYEVIMVKVSFYTENLNLIEETMIPYGTTAQAIDAPKMTGYTFESWDKPLENIKRDTRFFPVYSVSEHTLTLIDIEGNLLVTPSVFTYNSSVEPLTLEEKPGFIWTGFSLEDDLLNPLTFPFRITENTTVVAHYATPGLEYNIYAGSLEVSAGSITSGAIRIPMIVSDKAVFQIAREGFKDLIIEEVFIPLSVEFIEIEAFANNSLLETVNFEEGSRLKYIKEGAFLNNVSLLAINLPEGLLSIESDSFRNTRLKSLIIPESLTELSLDAFLYTDLKVTIGTLPSPHFLTSESWMYEDILIKLFEPETQSITLSAVHLYENAIENLSLSALSLIDITEISAYAFSESQITTVYLMGDTLPLMDLNAFDGLISNTVFYVDESLEEAFKDYLDDALLERFTVNPEPEIELEDAITDDPLE